MSQTWNGTKKETPERRTYTVDDIAQILGIGRTSAYILVKEGHFKIVRIGNAIRISKRSFDKYMEVTMDKKEKKSLPEPRTYTVEQIAAMLNIGRTTAYQLVKQEEFRIVRIGNAIRVSKKSFDEWLESLEL